MCVPVTFKNNYWNLANRLKSPVDLKNAMVLKLIF